MWCMCVFKHICVGGVILTSREGGCKDPGVSLRRSEEWRRLTLLREDSERSHSLPREAELCHYMRKHSQPHPCSSSPRMLASATPQGPLWALLVSSSSPGLPVLKCLDPPLTGYLGCSGSRALPWAQKAVHGAAAGWGRQVRGQLRRRNTRGRGAAGRSEQLLEAGTQPSSGGAGLILMPASLGHPPTWPLQGFSGLGIQG